MSRKILFWHSKNSILTFAPSRKILFWHSKSYFDIRYETENPILTFKTMSFFLPVVLLPLVQLSNQKQDFLPMVHSCLWSCNNETENTQFVNQYLFWHLLWNGKSYFDIQNPILTFKILFWHSLWVGKSYFDIRYESENPILTFAPIRKVLFWHSISYLDKRYESENPILTFKILFWPSLWVGEFYFYFAMSRKILFSHSKSYFDLLSRKILFWHSLWDGKTIGQSKSYFDILYDPENPIWHLKSYFYTRSKSKNPILTFDLLQKILFWHSKS